MKVTHLRWKNEKKKKTFRFFRFSIFCFSVLMQFGSYSSTDVQAHRRVVDQVFRILHDRRSFLGLSFWRPTRFSVWKIGFGEISSRIEVRVGVDYSISSWTTHVVSEIGEARHDDWNFHLVLPLPSATRGTANKVNLIAQQTRELDGPKTLLADIGFSDFPERLVLQYVDYDALIQILHSAFPYRVMTEAELQWETPEGILSLRSLEQVALPQAVFVDILIGDPACENGYTSDVEDSTSLVQTFLNLSGELCEDVGQERIEEIAVYFARQREFEQPLIMHALDTTRIYGEAAIFNVLSAENRHSTRIRVTQFGLDQMHIGIRDAVWHFDDADNLGSLFLLIRETWWDFLAQGDELFVCYIYPQPTLTNGDLNLLVDVAPFRGGTPILFQEASLTETFDYVATYTTHRNQGRMSLQIAFDALMLHDFCAIAECRVSFHTTELLDVQEVNTFPGQMWSVVADHSFDSTSIFEESSELESAEQDDEAYFMQIGGLGIFFDYDFLQNMRLFDRPGYRVAFWFLSVGASRWRCVNPTILEVNSLFGADFGWHQIFPEIRPTLDHYFTVVTPLPHSPGVLVMQHAIIYQFSVFDYVPLLVTVESDSYRSRDAWLVETIASEITVLDLFNLAFPQHRCNFEAFCIARKGGDEFDIQAVLTVEAGNHVILLHITPEPNEDEPSTASDFSSNPSDCLPGDGYDSDWSNEDDVASLLLLHSHREDVFQQGHWDSWSKGELAGMAFGISICPLLGGNENLVNVVPYKMQQALIVFHRLCPPGNTFKVFHLIHDWSTLDDVVQHDDFAVVFDWTPSPQNDPLRIRLESLLPQPEDSLQTKSSTVTLPELGPLFDLLCHSYQLHWPCNDVVEDNLPLSSLGYFEALRQIPPQNAKRVEIYTDGSFFAEQEIGGWAFVVIGYGLDEVPFAIHCAWGPMVSESLQEGWCGASKVGSRESEVEALIYALAWRIGAALDIPVHFLFDCNAAGFMASGIWGLKPSSKHDRVLRALAQLSQTLHPGRDKYDHVPGHRGVHGNEISDVLARLGAWQEANIGAQPLNLFSFIHNEPMEIEWLWLWAQQIEPHICFPSFRNNEMTFRPCFTAITTEEVFPAIPALQDCASRTDITKFELGILTYNVCSLKDGLREELLSNHLYLREQLVSHGYHIAAFQETPSRQEGIFTSDTHVRCVSKANKGAGGTELWFLRFQPGTRKALICTSDIVVVNNNEEFLAVKVRFANNFLFVISGHCPQSGRSDEDIDAWWEALRDTLKMNHEPRFQTVLCIDANAHFSYEVPPCIGDAGLEKKTNRSARCFSALLQDFDLFLPSTFSECHSGEHVTWRRSLKMEGARCDYIAIPQGWAKLPISSFLASTVDAGTTTFDHTAVGLWVKLLCQKRKPVRKPTFDRDAIRHVTQDQLYELSISFPLISWEENVHSHAMKLTRWLSEWLTKTFPAPVSSPKRSYISAECWEIRRQRLQAHRQLRRGRDCISRYYASTTLLAWRHSMTLGEAHDLCWHFLFLLLRQDRLLLSHIRELKSALRSHLRSDRTQFLTDIATEVVQAPAEKFFKILRRAGVVSRKFRTGPQPLPKLLLESGELAQTTVELVERWRSFFAQQEDGVVVSPDFLASQCQQCIDPIEVNWNEIPTLTQYEGAMRRMKSGKALFWDGLPGELFRFCAPTLGRICYPLFLKQCATEEEPLLFRGGRLTPLFKGKGARDQCSSYRSIFISPVLGKIHHRLFREQLAQYFEPYSLPMQLGGRPHKSVSQASHGLQLALADASQRGLSTAVIFVDIADAFYKAMRQHILPTPSDKRTVRELFHMLRLDDDAFGDFERYMICQTAFQDAEVPAHLENLLAQGLNTTWYGMDKSPRLTLTRRGSRPGDCYADIVFGFAFTRLLANVMADFRTLGCCQEVYWSGIKELCPSAHTQLFQYLGPIWADDLAVVLSHKDPWRLYDLLQKASGALLDRLAIGGMTPNFGSGKSEVLASWKGKKSVALRRKIAEDGHQFVASSRFVAVPLRFVGSYKHLGTWLQVNLQPLKEFKSRFGIAHATLTSLKTTVFKNSALPLSKKMALFDSLIASAVFYNSATWMPLTPRHQKVFDSGVIKLFRRVAILHFGFHARDWLECHLLEQLDVLHPAVYLRGCRLRYLSHLLTSGGDDIWALIQQFEPWRQLVVADIQWLQSQRRFPLPYGSLIEDWSSWSLYILESPTRWKAIVSKACDHARFQQSIHAHWVSWHRDLAHVLIQDGGLQAQQRQQILEKSTIAFGAGVYLLQNLLGPSIALESIIDLLWLGLWQLDKLVVTA